MAAQTDTNLFSSPWNDSDLVLVVEKKKLHVHRWILTSQSLVFKAMLEGKFREASQDKVILNGKDYKSMVQFLKTLYPSYMFEEAKASVDGDNLMSILALADEYQCINVIKHCIDEVKITPKLALKFLPYAEKYHTTALPRIFDVINWSAPTAKLKEFVIPEQNSKVSIDMLLAKCFFLESSLIERHEKMISLIDDFSGKTSYRPSVPKPTDANCLHAFSVKSASNTKTCEICRKKYKKKFIKIIPSCAGTKADSFMDMLQQGDDIATLVRMHDENPTKDYRTPVLPTVNPYAAVSHSYMPSSPSYSPPAPRSMPSSSRYRPYY